MAKLAIFAVAVFCFVWAAFAQDNKNRPGYNPGNVGDNRPGYNPPSSGFNGPGSNPSESSFNRPGNTAQRPGFGSQDNNRQNAGNTAQRPGFGSQDNNRQNAGNQKPGFNGVKPLDSSYNRGSTPGYRGPTAATDRPITF